MRWFDVEAAPLQEPKTPKAKEEDEARAEAEDSDYQQPDLMQVIDTSDEDSAGGTMDHDPRAAEQLDEEVTDTLIDADEIYDAPPPPSSPRKLRSGKMCCGNDTLEQSMLHIMWH